MTCNFLCTDRLVGGTEAREESGEKAGGHEEIPVA